ncbi:unnamed protein product [Calypogeia fissa]
MAVASVDKDDEVNEGIDCIELPFIDLRHFCGDELRLVAQFSGPFPAASFCDIVVPKIDRSCFNESAGSRRQTWNSKGSNKHSNRRGLGSSKTTSSARIQWRSIGLTSTTVHSQHTDELVMPDAGTRFRTAKAVARLTPNGKVTKKSLARQVAWKRAITRGVTNVAVQEKFATNGEIQGPVGGVAGIVREPFSRKRLRQPIEAFNDDEESDEEIARTRNKKSFRSSAASRDLGKEPFVGAKRSRGPLFGARLLEFQRPERAQKRRFREVDMKERLNKMKGKWASIEKTRKVVDASGFPLGWTVLVGLAYKDGRTLFEYRDWRSPDGSLWSSFKDASAYLLSSIGHDSTSKILLLVKPGGGPIGDEGTSSSKEESTTQTVGKSSVEGGFCRNEVPRVDLDQTAGRCSNVDKTPNLTVATTGMGITSNLDELQAEDCHRNVLEKGQNHESGQSACLLGSPSCGAHRTKTEDPSTDANLKESPRISDTTSNLTLAATGAEIARHVDELQAEDCQRGILNGGQTQQSGHSACLLERHSCGDRITEDLSRNADVKQLPRISYHESASGWMENSRSAAHSKIKEGQCTDLTPCNDSGHKCPSCGKLFSTLLKLRGHLRRTKNGRKLNCNICGRHFSSTALLVSHRVQMGHLRATGVTSQSRRLQVQGLEAISRRRGSKIPNMVLGLLSDNGGGIGGNVDPAFVAAKPSSKSTKNISPRDVLKVVNVDVGQVAEKNGDLSGIFECETCHKVFYRRSQYWGHQSVHAKERKKALKSSALSESVSKTSLDRVVGSESNLAMVVRENCGYEAGNKYAVQSVLWRLLDDSSPLERPNKKLDIFQDETVRPPSLHSKEEVTSEIGVLTY